MPDKPTYEELERRIRELEKEALKYKGAEKVLSGLLPICSSCKKIRDDKGCWNRIETYISEHSRVEFSHSICPDCAREIYPDLEPHDG